jgi:hypothetical protein
MNKKSKKMRIRFIKDYNITVDEYLKRKTPLKRMVGPVAALSPFPKPTLRAFFRRRGRQEFGQFCQLIVYTF